MRKHYERTHSDLTEEDGFECEEGCTLEPCVLESCMHEPLAETLEELGPRAGQLWLFCLYCERYFQAFELREDYLGSRQGCAFCGAAGFDVAIFAWDVWHEEGDPVFSDPRFM